MRSEEEIQNLCAQLLRNTAEAADEEMLAADPELGAEVERRLAACGVRLSREPGEPPLAVIDDTEGALSELSLACLALAAAALNRPARGSRRPRLALATLAEQVGKPNGYSAAYVRRAGIGPLEQRGLVRLVKPEQSASDAYLVAGPALRAIDGDAVRARIAQVTA